MIQNHLSELCVCVSAYSCERTVLRQFSFLTNLRLWALCHILSLPTRPPAAHQEEEIRTIPSCHCSATRAHGLGREGSHAGERRAQKAAGISSHLFTTAVFPANEAASLAGSDVNGAKKGDKRTLALAHMFKLLGGGAERRKQSLNKHSGRWMG